MRAHRTPYRIIDAFTDLAFAGNPAAVVLFDEDDRIEDAGLMQKLAIEYNLQETAFLRLLQHSDQRAPRYRLRWFTPVQEFPLCGHATLASSHYLLSEVHPEATCITFETMSGPLTATRRESGLIELDFPADDSAVAPANAVDEANYFALMGHVDSELPAAVVAVRVAKLAVVVELRSDFDLANAKLDATCLAASSHYFVFTQVCSAGPSHIYSRVLDGAEACPEDPVTGSAHCILAPYFLDSLTAANGRLLRQHPELSEQQGAALSSLRCRQGGQRQGQLEIEWRPRDGRVLLRGTAVTVMDGNIRLSEYYS